MGFFGRLVTRLTTKPITIVGVISADSGGGALDDDGWVAFVSMYPWRIEGGPLRPKRILLSQSVRSSRDVGPFEKSYTRLSVTKMRVRMKREDPDGLVVADIVDMLGPVDDDAELSAVAAELRKPVVITNDILGTMTLDRALSRFRGTRSLDATTYRVHVTQTGEGDEADIVRAAAVLPRFEARLDALRSAIAAEIVRTCGPGWTDGPPLTAEAVAAKLTLESAVVRDNDHLSLLFGDGDLFGGHQIEAFVNERLELKSAALAG